MGLAALPWDVLVLVCVHVSHADVEHLLATTTALRRMGDEFYALLALERWGCEFWWRAVQRTSRHRFRGWRAELRRMACFDRVLARAGSQPWGHAEYYAWWAFEAKGLARRQIPPYRPSLRDNDVCPRPPVVWPAPLPGRRGAAPGAGVPGVGA